MKYTIQTYGCAMNLSDSERVASVLERLGYEQTAEKADVLVLNTCSVKQKAEDRVLGLRKILKKLHDENPALRVAVTGCMIRKTSTQKSVEEDRDPLLVTMSEVDIAFRIEDVAQLPELLTTVDTTLHFEDQIDEGELENYFKIIPSKSGAYSVFVPIMTGCDKFCTYCIVPFTRGREKSRNFEDIVAECARHVREGAIEITLVGQTVNSYGLSFNDKKSGAFNAYGRTPFAALLREIDKLHAQGLRRLRFTSPHPRDFSDELIGTLAALPTICPYIHMPIQSGDDKVLRRMNRNYRVQEYKDIMRKIQKAIPGCAISTDIIVGFSGETDEEFENTYRMYEEMEWDNCFSSRYSPRKGTYSERSLKDDVPASVKAQRWHKLNELVKKIALKKHEAFVGQSVEALVTQQVGQSCTGRTRDFKEIQFRSGRPLVGQLVEVKVSKSGTFFLEGVLF